MTFDSHRTCLKSYIGLKASAWFLFGFIGFPFALQIKLGLPHCLVFKLTHCICDQPLYSIETTFFIVSMVRNELHPMMPFEMPLLPSQKTQSFTFHMNKPMSFSLLPFSFFTSGLTSCYQLMTFVNQPMLLLLILFEQN